MRATIYWLPPTLKYRGLEKIVDETLGGGLLGKCTQQIDQAAVYVVNEKERDVPHYLEVAFREESNSLLVTVPGRRTKCRYCSGTDHWSNRCPNTNTDSDRFAARKERRETFADKLNKAPPPPTTESTIPKHDAIEDNEADTAWAVVALRKKRRR